MDVTFTHIVTGNMVQIDATEILMITIELWTFHFNITIEFNIH